MSGSEKACGSASGFLEQFRADVIRRELPYIRNFGRGG
jgi:hypothetical protein